MTGFDSKKWVSGAFLAVAITGFMVFKQLTGALWDFFQWPHFAGIDFIAPADLVGVFCGVAVYWVLRKNNKATQFTTEVVLELSKVTWAQRKETALSTGVVAVTVLFASLVLFLFDTFWSSVMKNWLGF